MRLLYVVFVASILALLWAAWAIARTVRSFRREGKRPPGTLGLQPRPGKERPAPHDE